LIVRIDYKRSVFNDLRKIDRPFAERILLEIESILAKNPEIGEALMGQFKGLYKFRVGNGRVLYAILSDSILILRIGPRSVVYQ
jgi:mRNA interferase RelE/StbE